MDVRATGKSRSQRINIDYYRQKTWLTRSRGLLALAAGLAAVCYCLFVFAAGSASQLSTGPVAAAHASFESDCQQCHLDFTPIAGDSIRFASSKGLDRLEEACQQCHRVDHHFRSSMKPESAAIDQHCSGCHTDHLGRDNDMVNIASRKCTQCHSDLPKTCQAGVSIQVRPNVSEFTVEGHGTFAGLAKDDPGRVKFDHAQHMRPGQVDAGTKGGFTIAMLESNQREAYRKYVDGAAQADNSLVTLECDDCHQFAGQPGQKLVGDDEVGRHIAPIAFEQHCAACHSMNYRGRIGDMLPLPHAAPWKEVKVLLASKLVGSQLSGDIRMPRDAVRETPLVGEGQTQVLPSPPPTNNENSTTKELNQAAIRAGLAATEKRCLQCHVAEDIDDESIAALRSGSEPPLIPERWLARGIYDHAAHRKVACAFCHADAYAKDEPAKDAKDDEVVMIGGIETCVGCHRSAESAVPETLTNQATKNLLGGQSNWASDACIECHRYHWERPQSPPAESQVVAMETPAP